MNFVSVQPCFGEYILLLCRMTIMVTVVRHDAKLYLKTPYMDGMYLVYVITVIPYL